MEKQKIKSFTDLNAWKYGHQLVLSAYKVIDKFPRNENYALADQMRRCAVSITSNIAEGFSRQSKKEKRQFYFTAIGSLVELQNQLLIARDLGYFDKLNFQALASQSVVVHKLLRGLVKSTKGIEISSN